eukprot:3456180-Amphidinium_carterae.1
MSVPPLATTTRCLHPKLPSHQLAPSSLCNWHSPSTNLAPRSSQGIFYQACIGRNVQCSSP